MAHLWLHPTLTVINLCCSRVDGDILSKIIGNLNILLYDENVNIKKKVMLSMASLYKTAIKVSLIT